MGTPTAPASTTPAQTINLFLLEDLDDDHRTGKLAEHELDGLRAIADWIKTFEARSHPKLIRFNEVGEGNHFAAWQEPHLFTRELLAAFRSLRSTGITNNGGRP